MTKRAPRAATLSRPARRGGIGGWALAAAVVLGLVLLTSCGPTSIHDIQGTGHVSPKEGATVTTRGVVVAVAEDGFFLESLEPDDDARTSEGIRVVTGGEAGVVGEEIVTVRGVVLEDRAEAQHLSATQIGSEEQAAEVLSHDGEQQPRSPVELARPIPSAVGSVEGPLDPENEAIDFLESLEGMRVLLHQPFVVGPRSRFGEIAVLPTPANGPVPGPSPRGVLVSEAIPGLHPLLLDDALSDLPAAKVGDRLAGDVEAVVGYSFGNFKLWPTRSPGTVDSRLAPERAPPRQPGELRIATYNVENLDPGDARAARFDALARQIVEALGAPDLVALQEVQDSSGTRDDGTTDAAETYRLLIAAISRAGGPTYRAWDIAPENNADGGQPGGNIRVALLVREDGALELVERGRPAGPTTAATVRKDAAGPVLDRSPARIAPADPAFTDTRKSLAAELRFRQHRLFVVANHLSSRRGDDPLFGAVQPPVRRSSRRRQAQAALVGGFVAELLAASPEALVVVLGDFNDGPDSEALAELRAAGLEAPLQSLAPDERYTYIYEGRGEAIDHIFMSPGLHRLASPELDIVHLNAEFPEGGRASDHDPVLLRLVLP